MGMEMVADAVMVVGAKAVKRRAVAQHRGVRTRPVNPKQCQAVVTKADQRRVGLPSSTVHATFDRSTSMKSTT